MSDDVVGAIGTDGAWGAGTRGANGLTVAVSIRGRDEGQRAELSDVMPALRTPGGGSSHAMALTSGDTTGAGRRPDDRAGRARGEEYTHASFFSGVGGLDLGLERAGWTTVSVSEIDPYACAVLAERFPGVPNLGSIVDVAERESVRLAAGPSAPGVGRGAEPVDDEGAGADPGGAAAGVRADGAQPEGPPGEQPDDAGDGRWRDAALWSGGFPCQDLSVAGKRRGFGGERSVLAFVFLDLVERHRPPWVLLENVPGLLSSSGGRDFARLLRELSELGYGVAWRVLDARHYGVAQRRRRVFVLAARDADGRAGARRAAAVLAVAAGGGGGAAPGVGEGEGPERLAPHGVAADGAGLARTLGASLGHHGYGLGTQDFDGGYLQVADTVPAGLERGLGHNKDGLIVPTLRTNVRGGEGDDQLVSPPLTPGIGGNADGADQRLQVTVGALTEATSRINSQTVGQGQVVVGALGTEGFSGQSAPAGHVVRTLDTSSGRTVSDHTPLVVAGPAPDADGVRAPDGLAGRLDDLDDLADELPGEDAPFAFSEGSDGAYELGGDVFGAVTAGGGKPGQSYPAIVARTDELEADPLLPDGLDGHRYRCCGNGVVANVAEAIGLALIAEMEVRA